MNASSAPAYSWSVPWGLLSIDWYFPFPFTEIVLFRGALMRALIAVLGFAFMLHVPSITHAETVPDASLIHDFAALEALGITDPATALELADKILSAADSIDLRLVLARKALDLGDPGRALRYLAPVLENIKVADPRTAHAHDLADRAYQTIGDKFAALNSALNAYNAAQARLGPENPSLLGRLKDLEPRIAKLQPELLGAVEQQRKAIEAAQRRAPGVRGLEPDAVTVWYGTNRAPTGSPDPATAYGSVPGPLSVGRLKVTIPPNHLAGRIERPSTWSLTLYEDPDEHVVLAELEAMAREAFVQGCCGPDDKLLFIHGYNVTFHDGALRAAQLAYDLEFRGQALYYSWPSQASLLGYLTDANNVVASRPALVEFLDMATQGQGKLHIVAHSMGNRYALAALETFLREHPERRLGRLILAAPDVDRSELAARLPAIQKKTEGVTLYASSKDLALLVSKQVNGAPRAGDANGEPIRLAGLDTIDASAIEADTLGHSYFGDAPQLLGDILGLVRLELDPIKRCSVKPRDISPEGSLWEVRTDGCPVEQLRAAGDLIRIHGANALLEAQRLFDDAAGDELEFWQGVLKVTKARLNNQQ
jgi:esterase/lipase superfamily enzyme